MRSDFGCGLRRDESHRGKLVRAYYQLKAEYVGLLK
jgi:hypothetical protein